MGDSLSEKTVKEGVKGIVDIIRSVKTLISLAALALILVFLLVSVAIYQSETKSDFLIVTLIGLAFFLILFILFLATRISSRDRLADAAQPDAALLQRPETAGDDYDLPSTLVLYRHSAVGADNAYTLDILRVSTARFLRDGDVEIIIPRRSTRNIVQSDSLSNPTTAQTYGDSTPKGGTKTPFYGKKAGDQEILVFKSTRELRIGEEKTPPDVEDVVRSTLYQKIFKTRRHHGVGTRMTAFTDKLRLLVYFPENHYPGRVQSVVIDARGKITTDSMRLEQDAAERLWVAECDRLEKGTGAYLCWVWPH